MKSTIKLICIVLCVTALLSGCMVSTIARQSIEQSSEEFNKWVELFKARLDKMPNEDITPFTVWVVQIVGDDKARLPREGERLIDKIYTSTTAKPESYVFTRRERAELMGAWDRLFIILYEEAGKKGFEIAKRLMTAGIL